MMKWMSCLILFCISLQCFSQNISNEKTDLSRKPSLDLSVIQKTLHQFLTSDNFKSLGLIENSENRTLLASFFIRSLLKNLSPESLMICLQKITTDPRHFLKTVCYVNHSMWCYMGVANSKNSEKIDIHQLSHLKFFETLQLTNLLFDRYNQNIDNKNIVNQIQNHFKNWDEKNGITILKLFEENYVDDIQIAQMYIEKISSL